MNSYMDDGSGGKTPNPSLSFAQSKQAVAIMDCVARMVPHEGVDYDITLNGSTFDIQPLTDKGQFFRSFIGACVSKTPPDIPVGDGALVAIKSYLSSLVPREGVDFNVEIVFKGAYSPSVSMSVVAANERGEWWKRYIMEMIRKYPPTVENPEPSMPIDPEEPKENEGEGRNDAQVVS